MQLWAKLCQFSGSPNTILITYFQKSVEIEFVGGFEGESAQWRFALSAL